MPEYPTSGFIQLLSHSCHSRISCIAPRLGAARTSSGVELLDDVGATGRGPDRPRRRPALAGVAARSAGPFPSPPARCTGLTLLQELALHFLLQLVDLGLRVLLEALDFLSAAARFPSRAASARGFVHHAAAGLQLLLVALQQLRPCRRSSVCFFWINALMRAIARPCRRPTPEECACGLMNATFAPAGNGCRRTRSAAQARPAEPAACAAASLSRSAASASGAAAGGAARTRARRRARSATGRATRQ